MDLKKHYAAAAIAFAIWGFFALPLRALIDYSSGQILFFRILFSFLALAIILFFRRSTVSDNFKRFRNQDVATRKRIGWLTLCGGLLLTLNWLIFIYIVNHVNVKTASFSYLICPVITAVLGYVLLKERLTALQWISVALCATSCILIGMNSSTELGFSLVTALTYALYLISQRKNQGFDRLTVLGVQVTFSLLVFGCIYPVLVGEAPTEIFFYSIVSIISVVFTIVPLFLNLYALNKINSATIGIMMYINPLFNFTVAFIVYGEEITTLQMIAYGMIVIALIMFNAQIIRKLSTSAT